MKPGKREGFNQMIADLKAGVIDSVICWRLDRLSRSPYEGGVINQLLIDGVIKKIITYEKTYTKDDSNAIMGFELGMATDYSQILGKNVRRGQKYKVDAGISPGRAPLGFLNTTDRRKGEKEIIPDPERFHLVRKLWDLLLTNEYSVLEIFKKAKGIGLKVPATRKNPSKSLTKTGLYKIFRNRFFCGEFRWSGVWHEGKHKPMVTKREFERAQEIISMRDRPKKYKHSFAYGNSAVYCGHCKATVIGDYKVKVRKNGSVNRRTYYRCTHRKTGVACKEPGIREEKLEKQFIEFSDTITTSDGFNKWAAKWLHDEKEKDMAQQEAIKDQQRKQIDKIDKQLGKLIDLRLEEEIDNENFKFKKELLMSEKRTIKKEIAINTDFQEYRIDKTIEVFDYCKGVKSIFESGTKEEKQQALKLLGSRLFLKSLKLNVEPALHFKRIQKGTKLGLTTNHRFTTLPTRIVPGLDEESCQLIKLGGGEEELPPLSKNDLF